MKKLTLVLSLAVTVLLICATHQEKRICEQAAQIQKLNDRANLAADGFERVANDFTSLSDWKRSVASLLQSQTQLVLHHELRLKALESASVEQPHSSTIYRISENR